MATEVFSPMQGRIVELVVEPGAQVEEDDPILVLEALKMKIPIVAPTDGVLREYAVAVGDEVESDARLAVIDD